jgi:hypothetical protein
VEERHGSTNMKLLYKMAHRIARKLSVNFIQARHQKGCGEDQTIQQFGY